MNNEFSKRRGLGLDIGCDKSAVSWMKHGQVCAVKLPTGEAVVPSAVLLKPDGEVLVGRDAELQAWKYPGRFYSQFKPRLLTAPDETIGDGPTPVELTAHLIRCLIKQLLVKDPELALYPQFGGRERSADELDLCFTVPAGWGVELREAMQRTIQLAGIDTRQRPVRLLTEPAAGCRRFLHEYPGTIRQGALVLCLDFGGSTFDVTVLRFDRGAFHEEAAPLADQALGGRNFTSALASHLVTELGLDCGAAFSTEYPFRLEVLSTDLQREAALEVWQAAERIKLRLSTAAEASGFVQTPLGKREIVVTRQRAHELWADLWVRVEQLIVGTFLNTKFDIAEIPHVFVIGGSSLLPGFVDRVATLTKRRPAEVLVSEDAAHVVSNGAAEDAYFRDEVARLLEGGIGLRLEDGMGGHVYRVYVRPNQVIPPSGLIIEALGQFVDSPGGTWSVLAEVFEIKPGVRCADPSFGPEVFLDESEVILLQPVSAEVDFPAGRHDLKVGVAIDAQRNTNLTLAPMNLPDYEPIRIPLTTSGRDVVSSTDSGFDVVLILDCSRSMAGEKLVKAKQALEQFVRDVSASNVRIAVVAMGGQEKASVVVPWSSDPSLIFNAVKTLVARGGTHATEALATTKTLVNSAPEASQKIAVFFSDGAPHHFASALAEGLELKEIARLISVAIGDDASRPFLEQLATSPADFFEARTPHDILGCLHAVARLVQAGVADHNRSKLASA